MEWRPNTNIYIVVVIIIINMVRVNLIKPRLLTDEHLYAENVELDMLMAFVTKYPNGNVPEEYCLGKGHMSFFRNKVKFLIYRKALVQNEMSYRKTGKGLYDESSVLPVEWLPSIKDKEINLARIIERLRNPLRKRTKWRYCGKPIIDIEKFIKDSYENQNI